MQTLMTRFGLVILVLVMAMPVAVGQEAAPVVDADAKAPRLVCPEPIFNFDGAPAMSKVKHSFVLRNEGEAPLTINRVKATCGCTVAKLAKDVLEPGEETRVEAVLTLSSHVGKLAKTLLVYSNDPKTPSFRLTMSGTAVEFIKMTPSRVTFGKIDGDEPQVKELLLEPMSEKARFGFPKIESDSDKISVDVKPREEGKGYVVTLRTVPPLPQGYVKGNLRILTDNKVLPQLTVPFDAHVMGKIAIAPKEIILYEQAHGTPVRQRFVNIAPGSLATFKVTGVVTPLPEVTAEIIPRDKNRYLVKLLNLRATKEIDGKEVVITTDVAGYEKIVVPIRVKKRPSVKTRPIKPGAVKTSPKASETSPRRQTVAPR
jgi:uncharacterized protein DUF1573